MREQPTYRQLNLFEEKFASQLTKDLANTPSGFGKYEARCMCGWRRRYTNPYKASLGAKYHAELWCNCSHNEQGELLCYFCKKKSFHDFASLSAHVNECEGKGGRMNVGQYVGAASQDRLPLLDGKMFKKLKGKGGLVTGKMLACRQINSPKFQGLAMDFKNGTTKFSFLARFDRYDVGALCLQAESEETDDWIGQTFKFFAKQGEKGVFVNVLNPKSKAKGTRKGR